jgi:membrane protein YqaA with SNARE-associated domain
MKDLLIIYLAGMTGIFKAIPLGIMLQASPVWIALMTAFGGLTAAAILYRFGGWMQQMMKKKSNRTGLDKREERTRRLYSKYGIIGLGIFGTLLLGLHITIILGLIVVKAKKKLLVWTTVGILLWSSVITAAAASGLELFEKILIFR